MNKQTAWHWQAGLMGLALVALFVGNLFIGSVEIPCREVTSILMGNEGTRASWRFIVLESRLPQAVTALLGGAALSASGLLLQTAFHNPLAGPSILGINTGASLGVAIVILLMGESIVIGMHSFSGLFAVLAGAAVGATLVISVLLLFSTLVKGTLTLLIIGIMVGYLASSAVTLLNYFSSQEGIHAYTIWGMGSFGEVTLGMLPCYATITLVGLSSTLLLVKPLNALLLGERYAQNLGTNIRRSRNLILLTVGLLTASTTAFCGPIAFIGLSVPHIARLLLGTSNHNRLLPFTLLTGATTALACNLACNLTCILPGGASILPLNAVTPIFGAPVVIYILVNQRKIQYFN